MKASIGSGLSRARGWLFASRAFPIGLQMGAERLNLVQMQASGAGQPGVRAAAAVNYECPLGDMLASPPRLKTLVRRAFAEQPFKGRRVVACLPAAQVKLQHVTYSAGAGEEDAEAILRELRERTKTDLDETVIDYLPVREQDSPGAPKAAIVAIAARVQVKAYLDALTRAGLDVAALDLAPLALQRVVSWISSTTDGDFPASR